MELSAECQRVIDSVKSLALQAHPSMFWIEMNRETGMCPDRVSGVLRRWAIGLDSDNDYADRINILSCALDIQSQSIYGLTWDDLCEKTSWASICYIAELK